jgi:hypothetical protein
VLHAHAVDQSGLKLVKTITEASPRAGERTFSWDFKTADGKDAGIGQFIHRVNIDGAATSGVVERPARATPEDLAAQVATMIQNIAPSPGLRCGVASVVRSSFSFAGGCGRGGDSPARADLGSWLGDFNRSRGAQC